MDESTAIAEAQRLSKERKAVFFVLYHPALFRYPQEYRFYVSDKIEGGWELVGYTTKRGQFTEIA